MQLMPATARRLGVSKAFDPAQNVRRRERSTSRSLARAVRRERGREDPRRVQRRRGGRRDVPWRSALPGDARVRPEGDGAWTGDGRGVLTTRSYTPSVFRTVRGFLVLAPPAFVAALLAYLSARPRAVSSFAVYPLLADVLGSGLPRSTPARFVVVTILCFIVPYLVAGVLLFLADVGASAAASLWKRERRPPEAGPRPASLAPETFWTLVSSSILLAAVAGTPAPEGGPRRRAARRCEHRPRVRRSRPLRRAGMRPRPGVPRVRPESRGAHDQGPDGAGPRAMIAAVAPSFDTVVVLDFGSQYTQLIARRIREARVRSLVLPYSTPAVELQALAPRGIVLSGGPSSVYDERAPRGDDGVFDLGIPVLGLCYGMQLMARRFGGEVGRAPGREYGRAVVDVSGGRLLRALGPVETVWMSHGDHVETVPDGFTVTARTANAPVAAFEDPVRGLYGLQFHPEVQHTEHGAEMLETFLYDVCGCAPTWTMASFRESDRPRRSASMVTERSRPRRPLRAASTRRSPPS